MDANFDPATGFLVDLEYTPNPDFNSTDGTIIPILDTFGFTVEDDGLAADPAGGPDIMTTPERVDAVASITVVSINDDPLFDDLNDLTIDEDAPLQTVNLTGISAGGIDWLGGEPQDLRITATSSDISLFANPVVNYTSPLTIGTLQFAPRPDRYGSATVTVTLEDAGLDNDFNTTGDNLSVTKTFVVTVDPVNDAPAAQDQEFVTLEETPIRITEAELLVGSAGDADPRVGPPQDESIQVTRISALLVDGVTVDASNAGTGPFATPFGSVEALFGSDGFLIDVVYTPNENYNADNPRDGLNRRLDLFEFVVQDDGETVLPDGSSTTTLPPETSIATAGISVRPRNDAPVVGDDLVSSSSSDWNNYFTGLGQTPPVPTEDQTLIIPREFVLGNDLNAPADAVDETSGLNDGELTIIQQPITTARGGTVNFLPNGNMEYVPPRDAFGLDTFEYTVSDFGIQEDEMGNQRVESLMATAVVSISLTPVNDPPLMDQPEGATLFEDTPLRTVVLTGIAAGGGESQPLRVTATSDDTTLLPDPVVTYTSANDTGTLAIVPNPDRFGNTRVRVTVEDGGLDNDLNTPADNLSLTRTFIVRVQPVNDPPTLSPISDLAFDEDAGSQPVNLSGITAGVNENQAIRVTATSADPTLVADPVVTYTSPDSAGSLAVTSQPDRFGTTTITVTVEDAGNDGNLNTSADNLTVTQTFQVTVNPINDEPTLAPLTDQTINEDSGPQNVALSGISAGPNESQVIRVSASSDNPGLINDLTVDYTSPSDTGTLTYVSEPDQVGSATITVTVEDGGADNDLTTTTDNLTFTQQFVVNVTPDNDAPTIDPLADLTIPEDSPTQTVLLTGVTAGGGESQPIAITATSSNVGLIPDPIVTYTSPDTTGSLSLTPVADQFGTATVTVVLEDGGADGDLSTTTDNQTRTETFVVTVDPVNDDPTLDPISDQTVLEDAGPQTIGLSGITAGNAAESQPLRVTASSADPSLVSGFLVSYSSPNTSGTLTYTPQPDQFGQTTITVTVEDGGNDGDLNTPGDNGTFSQTFQVTVDPENDPPTLDDLSDLIIDEDSSTQTVSLAGITAGPGESQPLRVSSTSGTPGLIPDPVVTYVSPNTTGSLALTPVPDQFGVATITVTVEDAGPDGQFNTAADNRSVSKTFTVTVTNLPDPPSPMDDFLTTDEDALLRIDGEALLANDQDPDLGGSSTEQLSIVMPPVSVSALGAAVTYDAATDEIRYDPLHVRAAPSPDPRPIAARQLCVRGHRWHRRFQPANRDGLPDGQRCQ